MNNYQFLLHYIGLHKRSFAAGIVFVFLTNWLAVSIPVYIQESVDLFGPQLDLNYPVLVRNVLMIMLLAVAMVIIRTLSRILFFNPGRSIERILKNRIFAKLNRLQKDFYDQHPTGTIISIVNNDINGVRLMTGLGLLQIFNTLFALSLIPVKMWQMSPSLTVYCVLPVLVMLVIISRAMTYMRGMLRERMEELQQLSTRTVGFLSGVDVIKGNRIHDWAARKFAEENQVLHDRTIRIFRIRTFVFPLLGYIDKCLKIIILAVGGGYLVNQQLSIGEITAFLAYATLLALPFISLGFLISILQTGMAGLESVRRILDREIPAQEDRHLPDQAARDLFSHRLEVRDLSYTYPGGAEPVLKHINLSIARGEKVGILGKIGSGKSTLVNCLNRHLEIDRGRVFIDDHDVCDLSRLDQRRAVRTLTQDPFLFSDTITANIRFGSAHRENCFSIPEVLRMSDMADEVENFPAREQTVVGEKGILLSGGQKQRLSLARAMYTPCKLLILDNVLSAVDYETESYLLRQIFTSMQAQSMLIVSDRVSVLEKVDRILVLEHGEIIARGSHAELLAGNEYYRHTWELQRQRARQAG